jgi:hypothetical protein
MQQVVLRQRHQVLLMHNPYHQQLNTAGTVTQPTCATATGSFKSQAIASNIHTKCGIFGYQFSNASSGTYTFTQTNAAGCTPASSSIVVNAQATTSS